MQGEQQETGELRRLHLRLERANEHVNQLQSRLASQTGSDTSCSDQLAEAQRAQQAQQLEIESLQRQLAGSQASSSDGSSKEEEREAQHAQQQVEIQALRRQLQEQKQSCSLDRDQQLECLGAEIKQLQGALAAATAEATGAETKQQGATYDDMAAVNGGKPDDGKQAWELDCAPAQWCQLALQDSAAFCDRLALLQQELKHQRAELSEQQASTAGQKATITEQKAKLAQQDSRLAQAGTDLAAKASALQRCSEEVAELQSRLTDCKSVTSLQSEQLAVLQAEVDQLRCSLAAAEKLAGGSAADEQLRQEVKELTSRLQVRHLHSQP